MLNVNVVSENMKRLKIVTCAVKQINIYLMTNIGLGREDCQHVVKDEFLCMVVGCALGTIVHNWMFEKKVNTVQGRQDFS